MGPFFKTLFGDARTIAVVAVVLGIEILLLRAGQRALAVVLVPLATLAGVAWLAPR